MVFSPLIPRRTDLTKEHIIGNGGGGEEFFEHQQQKKKNNTNSWCVWPDISEICHNNTTNGIMEENDTKISILPN